jgi:hypothetical protein
MIIIIDGEYVDSPPVGFAATGKSFTLKADLHLGLLIRNKRC